MNADGSGVGRLTEEVVGTQSGAWSPDGKQIVFDSTESWDLWLVNADGSGLRKLSDAGSDPSWCDGGTRVVFVIRNGANSKAYSINADGTGLTRIGEPDEDHEVYKPKCRPSVP
jgi:Tol biopolymer transport system component